MSEGKNLVGVDIGTSSIKICQLKDSRKGPKLVKLGFTPLPRQTIVDGHVLNSQAVVEALNRTFADAKIKERVDAGGGRQITTTLTAAST